MITIKKYSSEYKIWKKRNDIKRLKKRVKFRKKKAKCKLQMQHKHYVTPKVFSVPKIFSIIKNPEETIKFLNEIIVCVENVRETIKLNPSQTNFIKIFSINMDNTIEITGDALMYLLTIIRNTRGNKLLPISWIGNFPKDKRMKEFLQNTGYLKYIHTSKDILVKENEHIQIQMGEGYEYKLGDEIIDIRQEIIDFTCKKLNKSNVQINFLMTMLTEMITNIKDHAYDKENLFEHRWYIFVENVTNKISYTFIDNGLGIPTTIRKKKMEKIFEKFCIDKEYKYIEAGVSGLENRSKTGLLERGNGLPIIYEQYTSNNIDKLVIISNKAYYVKENPRDLANSLNGTIFYWEIEKEANIQYEN